MANSKSAIESEISACCFGSTLRNNDMILSNSSGASRAYTALGKDEFIKKMTEMVRANHLFVEDCIKYCEKIAELRESEKDANDANAATNATVITDANITDTTIIATVADIVTDANAASTTAHQLEIVGKKRTVKVVDLVSPSATKKIKM